MATSIRIGPTGKQLLPLLDVTRRGESLAATSTAAAPAADVAVATAGS